MSIKKDKALVFIVTNSYVFALGAMLANLKSTNPNLVDDIIIYHDGISLNDQELISQFDRKCKFIEYTYTMWESEHKKVTSGNAKSFLNRYSHLAWSKYKIIELLQDYKKVLYLDLDIVIRTDISEIFELNGVAWRNGNPFGAKFGGKIGNDPDLKKVPADFPTPNAGLLYVTDEIDINKTLQQGREFLIKNIDKFTGGVDELVFSWLVYLNKLNLTSLDGGIYNTFPQMLRPHSKVIHFMGEEKPWSSEIMQTIFPEWIYYYKQWVNFSKKKDSSVIEYNHLGKFVQKFLNNKRWLTLLDKINFKHPETLKLDLNFENEWLILKYKNYMYYELKFNQYLPNYYIGLWVTNSDILKDSSLRNKISELTAINPECFKVLEDHRGIYIYSKAISEANLQGAFDYFYSKTYDLI